ncbi:glyoxalase/bleomycin resistance/dioxygenase family protein, partial [Streptomyces mirabilis]
AATTRLADQGLATDIENDTTCCYALQDKVWVHGPGQEPWEAYVVKADADSLAKQETGTCCADTPVAEAGPDAPGEAGDCCP